VNKDKALQKIAKEIESCSICPIEKTGKPVPGEGNSNADIVFIGEAPGKTEAATGRPFIGRSGKLLRSLINESGLKEEDVFITSPVKYLPLRGTPTTKDIDHGREHLDKQLAIIDPKIIVLLGNVAAYGVLKERVSSKKDHGKIIKKDGKVYMLTVHPAAGLRFPPLKKLLIEDFKKIQTLLA
jgi:uracil-DNA glycosylase family 4